jgi:hypothetical protein
MPTQRNNVNDLAERVHRRLQQRECEIPLRHLEELFEVLFYASLRTEEGRSICCQCVWIDPDRPHQRAEERLDRWQFVPLAHPLPFDEDTLSKLALATDERTSALVIFARPKGKILIYGLVDQGAAYHRATTFDTSMPGPRPGDFYASIAGPGRLVVGADTERLAELRVCDLVVRSDDVMMGGPVRDMLEHGRAKFLADAQRIAASLSAGEDPERDKSLQEKWTRSLCRLLYRMRGFGQGGAVLISSDPAFTGLDRHYDVEYDRLSRSLRHWASRFIRLEVARDAVNQQMRSRRAVAPASIRRERQFAAALAEAESEIDGVIWHIALLSRVDGLVLLTPDLTVRGFGVKIAVSTPLEEVWRAGSRSATSLEPYDYARLGTRHQSMMRYCNAVPGSVGFVVSHDGDVRAITKVEDRLVVWDNVRLTLDQYRNYVARVRYGDTQSSEPEPEMSPDE